MAKVKNAIGHHEAEAAGYIKEMATGHWDTKFNYRFENFFHPFVGQLIERLNRESLPGVFDAAWQDGLKTDFFQNRYDPNPANSTLVDVDYFPKEIDISAGGSYANYNWELFFHIPLTIAVHLSKTQRFAEAQRWFHYIFDPTSTETAVPTPRRFWKFLAFRRPDSAKTIDEVLRVLSVPRSDLDATGRALQDEVIGGYTELLNNPFQPHVVARTRHVAYQYCVVMKYLDNLIAWGDRLFQQDTIESINEATQRYVLAANILGARPQRVPPRGTVRAKTFAQLKQAGLGPIGNALVELEGQFPFNLAALNGTATGGNGADSAAPLFGIGRALYFCLPRNDKLLGYWDTVADRLYKIRNCMNIAGVVRPLALFDPPLDPGMLVKAAAAGLDVAGIVSGLNQPLGPVRSLALIQKALELCGEVRGLGAALLAALEKGDGERLALLRQGHELNVQQLQQEVRFLQWKAAQEATTSLLTGRAAALERLRYYQRLLDLPADENAPETLALDRRELTEENFDEAYSALVAQYDKPLTVQALPKLKLTGETSPAIQSGAAGTGNLYLNLNENADLNVHSVNVRVDQVVAFALKQAAPFLGLIPQIPIHIQYWGLGGEIQFGGEQLSKAAAIGADLFELLASQEGHNAASASKTGSHERRADEWMLQHNLAAHELMQNGRQVLASLLAEQIAYREYRNVQRQIENTQEVDRYLREKFSNEELYLWMQGEIARLYYEYYRFAFDTARKAERTMKQELMRPELDTQDFVKFNYWDGGRKGLLSGEALYLDVKRMELAYHESNRRELELTKHVSLRQLDPLALLTLKATGSCAVTVPEWLYDLDGPGHYMRRLKNVSLTVPSVVGPNTGVNCTLSLLRSSVRKSPLLKDGEYARQGVEDDRFADYAGAVQSVVTSSANNDSGMFETNLRDERFLPFEGAGAESTWKLDLPKDYRSFDYATISDVILHVRYTARQGVEPTKVKTALDALLQQADASKLALLFSLRHDFPNEWAAFVSDAGGADFQATIRKSYFPYFVQAANRPITVTGLEAYDGRDVTQHHAVGDPNAATAALAAQGQYTLTAAQSQVLARAATTPAFLLVRYAF